MGAPPYMPGQFDPQQTPQQSAQQQTPQPSTDDQVEALKQRLAQQATPPPQQKTSGVKGMLQNFFQGFGNAAMKEAGLPTPYDVQQKALQDYNSVANTQAMQQLHQAQMAEYQSVPLVGLDQKPVLGPDGKVITLPANQARTWYAGLNVAASRIQSAQINQGMPVNTTPDMQSMGLPSQLPLKQANTAQGLVTKQQSLIPVTDQIRKLIPSLPPSVQSIPASSFVRAATMMQPSTKQGFEWKETSPGVWEPLPTASVTTRGKAGAGATTTPGAPQSNAAPSRPAMPGKVYGNKTIYATDQTTGDTVQTNPQEVSQSGGRLINPRQVTQQQMSNDQRVSNRLVDVATKLNRYEDALNQPIDRIDRDSMAGLLGSDKFKLGVFGAEIPVDRWNQIINELNAGSLGQNAQNRLLAYYNMREAVQGYQNVLSGSGHGSDLGMNLNLTAVPSPVMPDEMGKEGIRQFKENLPIAARGVPTTPGQQSVRDILGRGQSNPTGGGFAAWKARQK